MASKHGARSTYAARYAEQAEAYDASLDAMDEAGTIDLLSDAEWLDMGQFPPTCWHQASDVRGREMYRALCHRSQQGQAEASEREALLARLVERRQQAYGVACDARTEARDTMERASQAVIDPAEDIAGGLAFHTAREAWYDASARAERAEQACSIAEWLLEWYAPGRDVRQAEAFTKQAVYIGTAWPSARHVVGTRR